jgi:RNA-directed DNA polymerase
MQALEERASDQGVLKLLRVMLRAGVMDDGQIRHVIPWGVRRSHI